ncbi:hypothetical protein PMIN06_007081 [Paraphaeosphaeria minitans]
MLFGLIGEWLCFSSRHMRQCRPVLSAHALKLNLGRKAASSGNAEPDHVLSGTSRNGMPPSLSSNARPRSEQHVAHGPKEAASQSIRTERSASSGTNKSSPNTQTDGAIYPQVVQWCPFHYV